jgi:hypothetical protein
MAPGLCHWLCECVCGICIRNLLLGWMRFEDETELEKRTLFVELGCYKLYDTSSGPPLRLRGRLLLLPLQGRILFGKTYTHTQLTVRESNKGVLLLSPLFFLLRLSLSPLWLSTVCSLWFLLHQEGWI